MQLCSTQLRSYAVTQLRSYAVTQLRISAVLSDRQTVRLSFRASMDIARTAPTKTRRNLLIGAGVVALVAITAWTMSLDPASQTIERSAVLIDSVRRGDVVREVRGPGTLVPEH